MPAGGKALRATDWWSGARKRWHCFWVNRTLSNCWPCRWRWLRSRRRIVRCRRGARTMCRGSAHGCRRRPCTSCRGRYRNSTSLATRPTPATARAFASWFISTGRRPAACWRWSRPTGWAW